MENFKISENIKKQIVLQNLTQKQISSDLDISSNTLSKYINDPQVMPFGFFDKLAKYLQTSVIELVEYDIPKHIQHNKINKSTVINGDSVNSELVELIRFADKRIEEKDVEIAFLRQLLDKE